MFKTIFKGKATVVHNYIAAIPSSSEETIEIQNLQWIDVKMARMSIQQDSLFESSKTEIKLEKHYPKSELKEAILLKF